MGASSQLLRRHSLPLRLVLVGITTLSTIGGGLVGFVVTLAVVVAKARARSFIFALEDLVAVRWELLPILLGLIGGFRLGSRRPRALAWATVSGLGGLLVGAFLGPLVGRMLWGDDAGEWASAVILGAMGLVAGSIGSLRIRHVPRHPLITATFSVALLLGLAGFGLFSATNLFSIDPLEFPEPPRVPIPDPVQVDAVVFLLGDGGAVTDRSPLLRALGADVERWSAALRRDSAVAVAYLGDVVYPSGVRDRDHPGFAEDSSRLWSQIDLTGGVEASRVGLLAVHPDERSGDRAGFGGYTRIIGSDSLYQRARTDPGLVVDDRHFLRARLLDALVGDWDRHSGQWRWGTRDQGEVTEWRAIPEDRDWAFSRIDGLLGRISRWLLPSYVGFGARFPSPRRLAASGDRIDHFVLNRLERLEFLAVARDVQASLTDSVITAAVAALPPAYLERERDRLIAGLKSRRDQLVEYAERHYRLLARTVHLFGIEQSEDVVEFERISKERVRVRLRSAIVGGPAGKVRFERLLDARETRTVKLFLGPERRPSRR
jgi:hypothetical protein